jgi:hypothetical protein
VRTYGDPPRQNQKPGPIPLADCVNDTTLDTPFGPGCWQLILNDEPPHDMVEGHPSSVDSRVMTAWYQGGTLFGALNTAARFAAPGDAQTKVGIEWFVVDASSANDSLSVRFRNQGVLAVAGNNVSMPAIAVNAKGQGAMGFTLMGDAYYPSAAWTSFGRSGAGAVHVVANGVGPEDTFTSYGPLIGQTAEATRWGDYGAATTSGNGIWFANEWIGQTCTYDQFVNDPTCGGTRAFFGNWDTWITRVSPAG